LCNHISWLGDAPGAHLGDVHKTIAADADVYESAKLSHALNNTFHLLTDRKVLTTLRGGMFRAISSCPTTFLLLQDKH